MLCVHVHCISITLGSCLYGLWIFHRDCLVYCRSYNMGKLFMKEVNCEQKFKTCHTWIWTKVDLLGDFLAPVFLFDQERVLGSQHNGTKPIRRSSGHLPSSRLVKQGGHLAPWEALLLYPLYLPGHLVLVVLEKCHGVPRSIQAVPLSYPRILRRVMTG